MVSKFSLVCAAALAVAVGGCSSSSEILPDKNEGGWFSKPLNVFAKPDWARPTGDAKTVQLGPSGSVGPEDLVGADGACAPEAAPAAAPAQPAAGETAAAQASLNPNSALDPGNLHLGGIALGMTECQAVRRAGLPSNVSIGADDKGERRTVVTYMSGPWPGIYTFNSGRLKIIDRVPEPAKPVKKPPAKKPKTAAKPQ